MTLLDRPRSVGVFAALFGVLVVAMVVALDWGPAFAADPDRGVTEPSPKAMPALSDEFLSRLSALPMQEGGRVKPLSSWAAYSLLQLNGSRSLYITKNDKVSAMTWAVEAFFYPEVAKTRDVFLIEDDQVLADLGLKIDKKRKRDRYSYDDLEPRIDILRAKLAKMQQQLDRQVIRARDLTPVQHHEMSLGRNIRLFENITSALNPLRTRVDVSALKGEPQWFDGADEVTPFEAFARLPALIREALVRNEGIDAATDPVPPATRAITSTAVNLQKSLQKMQRNSSIFAIFPPDIESGMVAQWLTPSDLGAATLDPMQWREFEGAAPRYAPVRQAYVDQMAILAAAHDARYDGAAFTKQLDRLREATTTSAKKRGEFGRVESEVSFYKFDPFFKAWMSFLIGFLLLAVTWILPNNKWFYRITVGLIAIALLLVITGITWRSYLRRLAPVSNLYDTIPFITAAGVLACLVTEWINKRRVAIVLAAVMGALGMWLEAGYQYVDPKDTMRPLEAVLRTNFWLSTHVTTVTIGYAAGLLVGALAHLHVLGRVFGFKRNDKDFYRSLTKMIYGTVCFGLLFSVIGTILGGIWANDSWGRFWGWDPKENGAMIICLWEVAILHARMGGYIKQHGLAMVGVMTTPIVAFSWWGVNTLGVGLHQYGYIEGVDRALLIFYIFEAAVLAAGTVWWLVDRAERKSSSA